MKAIANPFLSQKGKVTALKNCVSLIGKLYTSFSKRREKRNMNLTWKNPTTVHTCMCMWGCTWTCVHAQWRPKDNFIHHSSDVVHLAFETGSLTRLEISSWLGWQQIRFKGSPLSASPPLGLQVSTQASLFLKKCVLAIELNSGLYVHKEAPNQVVHLLSPQITVWRRIAQSQWKLQASV